MRIARVACATVAALLLTGCAGSQSMAHGPTPAACSDSLYLRLSRQHPDSLSERAWQRYRSLDSACVRARAESARDTGGMGMMGMGHGKGEVWTILAPLFVAGMVVAMIALRL